MMKKIIVLLMLVTVGMVAQKHKKPNIILILADDISAREFPIYKSDTWSPPKGGNSQDPKFRANTPVIDKIAKEGMYVKTAWASVVCSPSRAMLMTGRYPHLHKWWGNKTIGKYTDEDGNLGTYPLFASSPLTIGHVAKKGGYATMWSGKSQMRSKNLQNFGFDEGVFTPGESGITEEIGKNPYSNFVVKTEKVNGKKELINEDTGKPLGYKYYAAASWYWKPHVLLMNHPSSKKQFEWWPNTKKTKKEYGVSTYGPDVELDFVFDFMERKVKEDKPFFVYHTTHLGHAAMNFLNPSHPKDKWIETPKITWENGKYTKEEPKITGANGVYNTHGTLSPTGIHSHVNYLDYQMWLYLKKLKNLKIDQNTLIIFCADNGSSPYGKNSPDVQKGTHVPFMVYGPGFNFTKKGEQDVLMNFSDILPTIADIAGFEFPKDYEINGESMMPFLTTDKKTHRDWIYGYKDDLQLIRGTKVLKDGRNKWYDVREYPSDLISFPRITDWSKVDKELLEERNQLKKILPKFNTFDEAPHGPLSQKHKRKLQELEAKKRAKKKAKQNKKNKKG